MDYSSLVGLLKGVTRFDSNHATMDGGAIFVEYSEEPDEECVFESLRTLVKYPQDTTVYFTKNTAGGRTLQGLNQAIFIGSADGCLLEKQKRNVSMDNILLFSSTVFSYTPKIKSQVTSYATAIKLDFEPKGIDGSYIEVMPGEYFYMIPTTKDVFGNDAYQYGTLALSSQSEDDSEDDILDVELVGPRFVTMDNFAQNNQLSIKAGKEALNHKLFLNFFYIKSSKHGSTIRVRIKLIECKVGFTFNEKTKVCECNVNSYNSDSLVCNSSSHSYACVRYGFWHGNYDDSKNATLPCPAKNCNYLNGRCPNNSACPDAPDLCPLNTSLCREGRTGLLCSKCESNYSFTFAGERCVKMSTCSHKNTIFFTLGLVAYWICAVILVLFVLTIDLSVGAGIAYGIMYYFSVVIIYTENTVTETFLTSLVRASAAITQLYPLAFGDSEVCFVENWTLNLQHQLFHYVTPAAVIFLIVVMILVSRFCWCPKYISPAQNSPIHAICILILASYTSLTYTSFEILRPIQISGEWRVYADPDCKYFHLKHLPYALVALAFELLISLPICFLILFAPCLSGKLNLVKLRLKPILDEFQACYRPECRWFAGFYFLARQCVFVANVIPLNSLPENNIYLHSINAVILIVHCSYQPYKYKWLNVIDTLLLANLLFLSFFHLEYNSSIPHKAAVYILILLPSLYLALILVLAILKRISNCLWHMRICRCRFWLKHRRPETTREMPTAMPTHTSVLINEESETNFEGSGFFRDSGEREPLLADNGDSGRSSYLPISTNGEGHRSEVTTSSLRLSQMDYSLPQSN